MKTATVQRSPSPEHRWTYAHEEARGSAGRSRRAGSQGLVWGAGEMGPGLSPASAPLGLRRARVTATVKRLEAQARPHGLSAQGRPGEGPLPARTDTQPLAHSGKSPRAFCSAPSWRAHLPRLPEQQTRHSLLPGPASKQKAACFYQRRTPLMAWLLPDQPRRRTYSSAPPWTRPGLSEHLQGPSRGACKMDHG